MQKMRDSNQVSATQKCPPSSIWYVMSLKDARWRLNGYFRWIFHHVLEYYIFCCEWAFWAQGFSSFESLSGVNNYRRLKREWNVCRLSGCVFREYSGMSYGLGDESKYFPSSIPNWISLSLTKRSKYRSVTVTSFSATSVSTQRVREN